MLHSGILPHHTKWVSLFENLKYIVIDEIHTYKGVFGSHVAHVIKTFKTNLCILWKRSTIHLYICDDQKPERISREFNEYITRIDQPKWCTSWKKTFCIL